jgi:hypothetical protein
MTNDRLSQMADDVSYIRARVDQHIAEHAKDRVLIENRLTSVEVRSGFWGILGGLLGTVGLHWGKGQ